MALVQCKECNKDVSTDAKNCPHCGAKAPKKTSLLVKILAVVFGIGIIGVIFGGSGNSSSTTAAATTSVKASTLVSTKTTAKASAQVAQKNSVEDAKVLAQIRERYDDNQKRIKKYYASPSTVNQAAADILKLAIIKLTYADGKTQEEKALSQNASTLGPKLGVQTRALYASSIEEIFVKSGMDVKVKVIGKGQDQLSISYALMSQPLVYKFQNEMELDKQASSYGFKKLVYTNGFRSSLGKTWTVDL